MARFLHIADIHLGIRRYRSEERARDFFLAWNDCIEKYAINEKVSFVLIAGDLFDARKVEPQAMNQAMFGFMKLQEAGIPAIVIEGNHDCHETEQRFSWLRSLSSWGMIKLLEPVHADGTLKLLPWDDQKKTGSFIDIDGCRIFGSIWYGSTIGQALTLLIDELRDNCQKEMFNIMMLHTDVEGQLNRPIPALPTAKIEELKSYIDYLALGHTHKNFEIGGWVYNPGSLEACNVDEFANERGAYLVDIEDGKHTAKLMRDYYQRPVKKLMFDVTGKTTPDELKGDLFEYVRNEMISSESNDSDTAPAPPPVVDLVLRGSLGFNNSLLEADKIRESIREEYNPLLVNVRNQTIPVEYAVAAGISEHISRKERELRVIEDLVARDSRFKDLADIAAAFVLEAKRMALNEDAPARITELIDARSELFNRKESKEAKELIMKN